MNEPASGPQRAVRTMGLNIRGERERERERSTLCTACNKRGGRARSFSLSFSPLLPSPPPRRFLLWRREQREHRAWMEEQCTPYINIVPITRSPGGYRSSKTPANFGRRTVPTREPLSSASLASRLAPLLLRPPGRMKKRGRDRGRNVGRLR